MDRVRPQFCSLKVLKVLKILKVLLELIFWVEIIKKMYEYADGDPSRDFNFSIRNPKYFKDFGQVTDESTT